MKNQVIEVLNDEHGKKVIEYWESQGFKNIYDLQGDATRDGKDDWRYYGIIDGVFDNYTLDEAIDANAEIIELPTESPKEENTFPRVMLVSCDAVVWHQAVVEGLRGGCAFATIKYSSIEEYEDALERGASVPFYFCEYHKEISDGNKVSKSKIAEVFNIPLEKLEIVD